MTAITGNTFPVRVALRDMGGQWNAGLKAWMVPDEKADLARALVPTGRHGERAAARPKSYRSYGYRSRGFSSGCTHEDYPCCGCGQ